MPVPVTLRLSLAVMLCLGIAAGAPPVVNDHPATASKLLAGPGSVTFAVIGDYGWGGTDEADVAALVQGWHPDFIVTTGDNNYPAGAADTIDATIGQYYHDYIAPYTGTYGAGATANAFFPVLGNHDWLATDAQPYRDYFTLPGNERYYTVTRGPVQFVMVDSDSNEPDGIGVSSAQATWARTVLLGSTATWQLVLMHHPPYSSSSVHGSTPAVQWPYAAWGGDLVFAGHDHIYERLSVAGLTYIVNGAGGAPLYAFGTALPESVIRDNSAHGAQLCTATIVQLTCRYITTAGTVVDTVTLSNPFFTERTYLASLRLE